MNNSYIVLTEKELYLPLRESNTHKSNYGRILIIGGSLGYSGAPCMSAKAALRVGAGLVHLSVPKSIYAPVASSQDEIMVRPYLDDVEGMFSGECISDLTNNLSLYDAILVGPGLGRSDACIQLVKHIIEVFDGPLVIDADGLFAVSVLGTDCIKGKNNLILTPHIGEFLRLSNQSSVNDISKQSAGFSRSLGVNVVLKSFETAISFSDGSTYLSRYGNPGMATGGSGDVLAGMIVGFLGQFSIRKAVINAVYIHGCAGNMAASELSEYSMLPTDIISCIPAIIKKYTPMREGIENE